MRQVNGDLPEVTRGAGLDERLVRGEAQAVHVAARAEVVQRVHDDVKLADERHAELGLHDVVTVVHDLAVRVHFEDRLSRHLRLRLTDVALPEEELRGARACVCQ